MRWLSLIFSLQGRVGRQFFWLSHLVRSIVAQVLVGTFFTLWLGDTSVFDSYGQVDQEGVQRLLFAMQHAGIALAAVVALDMFIGFHIDGRRLHDRGKSALCLIPMQGPFLVFLWLYGPMPIGLFLKLIFHGPSSMEALLGAAMLCGPIWYGIELGFLRGDPDDNAYGPPPMSSITRGIPRSAPPRGATSARWSVNAARQSSGRMIGRKVSCAQNVR